MYENEKTEVLSPIEDIKIAPLEDNLEQEKTSVQLSILREEVAKLKERLAQDEKQKDVFALGNTQRTRLPQDFRNGFVHPVLLAVMTSLFGILFITMAIK